MPNGEERTYKMTCGKPTKHQDQGWSWVVLITSFTIQLLCDGSVSAYGVVYAGVKNDTYFAKANYTEEQIALPGAIQSCLYVFAMGFVGPIVNTLGFQLVACVGSLMAGLSLVAAVFFKDIIGMIVFYGVFSGMGLGSLYLCACVAVTYYFERYRGAASGIAAAGNGIGYIVVPAIISKFTGYFGTNNGWRNGVLAFGIILSIVTFLCGLTLRPLEIEATTEEEMREVVAEEPPTTSHAEPKLVTPLSLSVSSPPKCVIMHPQLKEEKVIYGDNTANLSTPTLSESPGSGNGLDKTAKSSKSFTQRMVDLFDLTLFCNCSFIIFSASSITLQLAYFVPFVYFYTFVIEAGLTKEDALMLLTILGILHTFGRLLGGILANIPCVDIVLLTGASFILCGGCHFSLPFLPHNFTNLAMYAGAYGLFSAIPCPIFGLIIVKYLGLHRLTMTISNSCLIKVPFSPLGPIIAAAIKDSTGKLDGTFYWCGACFAITGILLLLLKLLCVKEYKVEV